MSASAWLKQAYLEAVAIQSPIDIIPCHFGCADSIGIFHAPEGCACFPEARFMALCAQHAVGLEANGLTMFSKWKHGA